jgi:2-keto-3-deoxy-L-fuconate dehydrogenase
MAGTFMANLEKKRVLITAAAQGIGRASVKAFVKAGAEVVATDINETLLSELSDIPGVTTHKLDVLKFDQIRQVIEASGQIDILFNCAGVVHDGSVLEMSADDLQFAFDLNVKAQVAAAQAVLPQMLERQDGCIINMSSVASSVKSVPNRAAYSITKAAVIGLTKALAADYVADGIRSNAIAPGTVDSPSLRERLAATGDYDAAREAFVARQPMGRIAQPEEIADLAVYLAGATFTTGQVYTVDGGWTG